MRAAGSGRIRLVLHGRRRKRACIPNPLSRWGRAFRRTASEIFLTYHLARQAMTDTSLFKDTPQAQPDWARWAALQQRHRLLPD